MRREVSRLPSSLLQLDQVFRASKTDERWNGGDFTLFCFLSFMSKNLPNQ